MPRGPSGELLHPKSSCYAWHLHSIFEFMPSCQTTRTVHHRTLCKLLARAEYILPVCMLMVSKAASKPPN
jgi:hypothetical protein